MIYRETMGATAVWMLEFHEFSEVYKHGSGSARCSLDQIAGSVLGRGSSGSGAGMGYRVSIHSFGLDPNIPAFGDFLGGVLCHLPLLCLRRGCLVFAPLTPSKNPAMDSAAS